jgi:hypothetical protein
MILMCSSLSIIFSVSAANLRYLFLGKINREGKIGLIPPGDVNKPDATDHVLTGVL